MKLIRLKDNRVVEILNNIELHITNAPFHIIKVNAINGSPSSLTMEVHRVSMHTPEIISIKGFVTIEYIGFVLTNDIKVKNLYNKEYWYISE